MRGRLSPVVLLLLFQHVESVTQIELSDWWSAWRPHAGPHRSKVTLTQLFDLLKLSDQMMVSSVGCDFFFFFAFNSGRAGEKTELYRLVSEFNPISE